LPDRLPARCPEKTGRLRRKLNFGTSTIDRAPGRSDRFQAINPERQPALLVRSGPGSSLLYAPDFPGRKSPCRNAAEAHVCEKHDRKQRIVSDFCTQSISTVATLSQTLVSYKCVQRLDNVFAPPVAGRYRTEETPLVPTGGVSFCIPETRTAHPKVDRCALWAVSPDCSLTAHHERGASAITPSECYLAALRSLTFPWRDRLPIASHFGNPWPVV